MLVLNAAVMMTPLESRTEDGFETQMGVNHLGHFLLTRKLAPLLETTASEFGSARVVVVSCDLHRWSNRINVLFAKELARRSTGLVKVYCANPGYANTDISVNAGLSHADFVAKVFYWFYLLCGFMLKTPWDGAQTVLRCCVDQSVVDSTGRYYDECIVVQPGVNAMIYKDASDLWDMSQAVTKSEDGL